MHNEALEATVKFKLEWKLNKRCQERKETIIVLSITNLRSLL